MAVITVFLGSYRDGRQGRKLADWLVDNLESRGHAVHLVDPAEQEIPMMKRMYKEQDSPLPVIKQIKSWIDESDGFIAMSPEYNHSFSAPLKNALDYFLEEYYGKPWAIVSYSAGSTGGIRAAEALRLVLAEFGGIAISISLGVSKIQDAFDIDGGLSESHSYVARGFNRMAGEFEWYVEALGKQRQKGLPF